MDKREIIREFSRDPDRYYKVRLFEEEGFVRKSCRKCGRYYWTLDPNRTLCPDDADDTYSFIGQPPTPKRFDYVQSWKQVEDFFVRNGHTSIGRYPVVCRWRDDLYFTIASIVDFQRVMGSKVVFEFPANPLIIPQTCLRFKDLENVGVTGRHFSSFCMVGQHSIPNSDGYWKDECVDLDFRLLTDQFGIYREEVVFVEDVWAGGGSFGSSLEYFVRGLELGNAVFTEFQGDLGRHTVLDQKIIDMGAGLERFAWITMGTPTAYDCCFGPITGQLLEGLGIEPDPGTLQEYFSAVARTLEGTDDLAVIRKHAIKAAGLTDWQASRIIAPLEGVYLIADHLRTLIFAISDGALPSNVGGGYNLRMMLRRINATIDRLGLNLDIDGLIDAHVDYLKEMHPELDSRRDDVKNILKIETERYGESRARMEKIAGKIRDGGGSPSVDELVTLYESDGVTPDYLREVGAITEIPSTFYSKLAELHQSGKRRDAESIPLENIKKTDTLFYKDDPPEFEARVTKVLGELVVLDRTSFYARGGGQEPDHGTIAGFKVIDVSKHADVIVHKLEGGTPAEGQLVTCKVNTARRINITRNHTSTHILNAISRKVLGSWVWQHSAFKDEDHARLDITHHSSLSVEQVNRIEDAANDIIRQNLPVNIEYLDRGTAEQTYGFRIYQGGVVPVKSVRIVSIGDIDVEACGGTHVKSTGNIESIKITRTKRIQDGVVRLEFVSGPAALKHARDNTGTQENKQTAEQNSKEKVREENKKRIPLLLEYAAAGRTGALEGFEVQNGSLFTDSKMYDRHFHIGLGKRLIAGNSRAAYCGIFESESTVGAVVYCGADSGKDAAAIAGEIAKMLGGSSGGDSKFAQGGGKDTSKKGGAVSAARSRILD